MFSGSSDVLDFRFYESNYFDEDFSKRSGGQISETRLSTDSIQSLGPIRAARDAQPIVYHYRKIFFSNNTSYNLTGVRAYIEPGTEFLSLSKEKAYRDYSVTATGLPNGYGNTDFTATFNYEDGVDIGSVGSGNSTGLWLKIGLTDDSIINEETLSKTYSTKVYFEGFIE